MSAFDKFLFDFTTAFNRQLVDTFASLAPVALTPTNLAALDPGRGVYRLHHPMPDLAYVGKADDLPSRLAAHTRKLDGRVGISAAVVGFTCLYVEDSLMTASPEGVLIRHYKDTVGLPWNGSGFGSRDPGKARDRQQPGRFDGDYPIDLNVPTGIPAGTYPADEVIARLAVGAGQPYLTRVEGYGPNDKLEAREERTAATVTLAAGMTIEQTVDALIAALRAVSTPGTLPWNGAALYGCNVVYKTAEPYPYNLRTY